VGLCNGEHGLDVCMDWCFVCKCDLESRQMWDGWGRWMYGLLLVMQWELSNDEARLYVLTKLSMCLCDYLFNLLAFV